MSTDYTFLSKESSLYSHTWLRILITRDDLWCHPIRSADESVPAAHGAIQLCTHTKVHWCSDEIDGEENSLIR